MGKSAEITFFDVDDIRFPSSLKNTGAGAQPEDPDYSCAYVTIYTTNNYIGYGLVTTNGKGNEVVVEACKLICKLLIRKPLHFIYNNFGTFWESIINNPRVQSMQAERGVAHLALAGVENALWDLWARIENKPLWKLLVDMTPEELVSHINCRYISDLITKSEMIEMLRENEARKEKYEKIIKKDGYPAYISDVGAANFPLQKIKDLCTNYAKLNFNTFKIALHSEPKQNNIKCMIIRIRLGYRKHLLLDLERSNHDNIALLTKKILKPLTVYYPLWAEEVLHPDDVLGYKTLKATVNYSVLLAGGKMCTNVVEIKQIIANSIFYCLQFSVGRLGIKDSLTAYFLAKKFNRPICPHTAGIGLCEMVQHLQMWDFICLTQSAQYRMMEFIDYKHGYFVNPVHIINGHYMPPTSPGYSTMFKKKVIKRWSYPHGDRWKHLLQIGYPEYFQCKQRKKDLVKLRIREQKKKNRKLNKNELKDELNEN